MKPILQRLWQQLLLVYRLTFHPDLDSTVYLNRTRLNLAALTMLALDLVYALLWIFVFEPDVPHTLRSSALLIFAASVSALAFINLHLRIIPWVSQLAVVVFCLWLNMPVLGIYIYLLASPPVHALANTIILLLLYMHVQDWRSSAVGIVLACGAAPVVYFLSFGVWPQSPPLLQIFMLSTVLMGGVIVAISSADITKMRKHYTQKVLQVSQSKLRPALQQQAELIGNMRYEARNLLQNDAQRLALDDLASQMQTQIAQLSADMARLAQAKGSGLDAWQSVSMLRTSDILAMAGHDLMANYHLEPEFLDKAIVPSFKTDVLIEANAAEISQALAALLANMLQSGLAQIGPHTVLTLTCWEDGHVGKLRIQANHLNADQHNTPAILSDIPPFSAYVFRLFHVTWKIHSRFADGRIADMELSCPLPSHV